MDEKLYEASMASLLKKVKSTKNPDVVTMFGGMMKALEHEHNNGFLYEKLQFTRWPSVGGD